MVPTRRHSSHNRALLASIRTLSGTLSVCLLLGCTPIHPLTTPAVTPQPAAAGVGVCHWIAPDGLPDEVGWGTETTRVTHWKELEPSPGVRYWDALDQYVRDRQDDGVDLWLAIQTGGAGIDGQPKAPQWLLERGAVWHTAGCGNYKGIFAPWDRVYLRRLTLLLRALNQHLLQQDALYQRTVAGIVMMSGGVYGETHLYEWDETCSLQTALRDYYALHLTDEAFNTMYTLSVLNILDVYMAALDPQWPIMVQLGRPTVDEQLLEYGSAQYPDRLYAKWAGWAPTNVGDGRDHARRRANQYYTHLFAQYRGIIPCGFEPGHPTQEWLGPDQYLNAMQWALDAHITFTCFQAGHTLWTAYSLDTWAAFDAQLEANATFKITPIPTATATCTPAPTPTPTPTPEPLIILHCECRPVTVTPRPIKPAP